MTLSIDQFRSALLDSRQRAGLGIALTDADAQLVVADPMSSQAWYGYWISIGAPIETPAAVEPPHPDTEPLLPFTPPGQSFAPPASSYGPDSPSGAPPTPAAYPTVSATPAADGVTAVIEPAPFGMLDAASPPRRKNVGLWVTLAIVGVLILAVATTTVYAFVTARHWDKVDVPAQAATTHSEEYETGRYDVTMDTVNPCAVRQDWTECTDAMARQYELACAGVELTEAAVQTCAQYSAAIDDMKHQDGDGYYVDTLGDFGHLSRTPEIGTREVSNNDARPAITHRAVCYLGFIGECR
ncbi:hypothetical protein ACTJJ4_03460 [Microbacterium sp. 22195]|uniref:hypothetical protein n=1 Tax=Microbacterium sp. 22195 TaxID=3453891 RepID=UPI003F85B534